MSDLVLNIAKDFTKYPGGRYRKDGIFSGEEFRENWLVPKIAEAIKASGRLVVELDGTFGYAASFLDEAFGGLVRNGSFEHSVLEKVLRVKARAPHVQLYKRLIEQYMEEAKVQSKVASSA